jgi:hypothetical protein
MHRTPGSIWLRPSFIKVDYDKYCLLVAALTRDAFRMVGHLIGQDQQQRPADAYTQLKRALVSCHVLSDFKKVELLSRVEPLGGRRPSELLTAMPERTQSSPFFAYLFMQRLPREIRILLTDDDTTNMRALAAKADRLLVMHSPQPLEAALAAVALSSGSEEENTVAAAAGLAH